MTLGSFSAGEQTKGLDVSDLPNGLYLVKLSEGTNSQSAKISVIH